MIDFKKFAEEKFPELRPYTSTMRTMGEFQEFCLKYPYIFWSALARSRLTWFEEFRQVCYKYDLNVKHGKFDVRWFVGGKLNVSVNCVDRHYAKNPDKIALIWEKDEPGTQVHFTYGQLYRTMNQIANMFKSFGVKRGKIVAFYVHVSVYAVAAMLACARLGIIHTFIFAELPPAAIAVRINEAKCVALVTDNQGVRSGKRIELRRMANEAVKICPTIKNIFVINRTNEAYETNEHVHDLLQKIGEHQPECEPAVMDSEDTLFLSYSSGSTNGVPKAFVHTQAGFCLTTMLILQSYRGYSQSDVCCFVGDIAWIAGHAGSVYGALGSGITSVLFDTSFLYPNPGRYWDVIERYQVNVFGTYPTNLRVLRQFGDDWITKYNRSSLKSLALSGEPFNDDGFRWFSDVVGNSKVPISNAWGSTEFGGCILASLIVPTESGGLIETGMQSYFTANVALLDDSGKELPKINSTGHLVFKTTWPSMARSLNNNHEKFIDVYLNEYPGYFYMADRATFDMYGRLKILGREDDVIKIRSFRVGGPEVEDVINTHENVVESAVVRIPNKLYGYTPYVYVVLKKVIDSFCEDTFVSELKDSVKTRIADYAVPTHYLIVEDLPKSVTGKIIRRVLQRISEDAEDLGDLSVIQNKSCLNDIINKHKQKYKTIPCQ